MMTWLSKIRTYLGHDEPLTLPPDEDSAEEARRALERATNALGEAVQRRDQVRDVTSALERIRERNHFGESIELAMMRKGTYRA